MKTWNVVALGIAVLTVLAATGCPLPPQPPTGVYEEETGWLGVHNLYTDGEGVISGSLTFDEDKPLPFFPAACIDITYTITGIKGPAEHYDEEVFYRTILVGDMPEDCPFPVSQCYFLDDTSAAQDYSSMDGRMADCTSFPYVLGIKPLPDEIVLVPAGP